MALSAEKLPTFPNQSRDNSQKESFDIAEFLNSLCSSFSLKHNFESVNNYKLKKEFYYASFAVLNYFFARILVNLNYFSPVYKQLDTFCSVLFLVLGIFAAYFSLNSTFQNAAADLRKKLISTEVTKSVVVIVYLSYLLGSLIFNFNYFVASSLVSDFLIVNFFLAASGFIETYLFSNILSRSGYDLSLLVPQVNLIDSDNILETKLADDSESLNSSRLVDISQVQVGDILCAREGETVPLDGEVIDGKAQVQEVIYCPKGTARMLVGGDRVFSGTRLIGGQIVYKVTALKEEALSSDFTSALNNILLSKHSEKIQSYNSNLTIFCIVSVFFAITAALFWFLKFNNIHAAVSAALCILLINLTAKMMRLNLLMPVYVATAAYYKGIFNSYGAYRQVGEFKEPPPRLVFDYDLEQNKSAVVLSGFELIDRRIDEKSMPSILFSLTSRGDSPECMAIADYISDKYGALELFGPQDFMEYFDEESSETRGFVGKVSNIDFTAGSEEFLIERGVQVSASEVDDPDNFSNKEFHWYLALRNEVIGSLHFVKRMYVPVADEIKKLKQNGIKITLCSKDDSQVVDEMAQSIGFELAEIYAGLNEENYQKKLESVKPFAFYYSDDTCANLAEKADLSITKFNHLEFNLTKSDLLVFDNKLNTIADAITLPITANKIEKQNFYITSVLSLLLLGLSAMNLISPVICLFAVFSASCAVYLNMLRLQNY